MPKSRDYKPRLLITITEDQFNGLMQLFDHGMKTKFFTLVVEATLKLSKPELYAMIARGYVDIRELFYADRRPTNSRHTADDSRGATAIGAAPQSTTTNCANQGEEDEEDDIDYGL